MLWNRTSNLPIKNETITFKGAKTVEDTRTRPYWMCQECGHENHKKPMPKDHEKFYEKIHNGSIPKCPKCKSEGFMPVGY